MNYSGILLGHSVQLLHSLRKSWTSLKTTFLVEFIEIYDIFDSCKIPSVLQNQSFLLVFLNLWNTPNYYFSCNDVVCMLVSWNSGIWSTKFYANVTKDCGNGFNRSIRVPFVWGNWLLWIGLVGRGLYFESWWLHKKHRHRYSQRPVLCLFPCDTLSHSVLSQQAHHLQRPTSIAQVVSDHKPLRLWTS